MEILLKDALKIMENKDEQEKAIPFSIVFITADRKKKTGGSVISLDNVILAKNDTKGKNKIKKQVQNIDAANAKNPNHYVNGTRNLKIVSSKQIRKCHIRLIDQVNGYKVIW